MDIRVNLIQYPLYVLGSGTRVGLWFQGCSLACEGCISQHTWSKNEGELYSVEVLANKLLSFGTEKITITGGEAFEQSDALKSLLLFLREGGVNDILVYSGFSYAYLEKNFSDILTLIDVLIVGRFEKDKPTEFVHKGSENQEMIVVNKALKDKYQAYREDKRRRLQVTKGKEMYVLGIPKLEDELFKGA